MTTTNTRDIKTKSGLVILANSACALAFSQTTNQMPVCLVSANGVSINVRPSHLPAYFSRFKAPSMRTLEKWVNDGICKSVLGKTVEPDGYDEDGSPSWLLALGMI